MRALARSTIVCRLVVSALIGSGMSSIDTQAATLPSCTELVSKAVTLRGTLSTVIEGLPPMTIDGHIVDVGERIFLLTLKSPLCRDAHMERPIKHLKVVAVEVVPGDPLAQSTLQSGVGRVISIRGTLSENGSRYRAPMLLSATAIVGTSE
jgi:hypothetical protein